MKLLVLGSSAGGGFPQWNCNCPNCHGLRQGTIKATARTQSSIAISENGSDWLLINASPDILTQIQQNPALQPARSIRDSGIAAVLLMDAQIDHVTGLLMLRERSSPLPVYATQSVLDDLHSGLPLINTLSHYCTVTPHKIQTDQPSFTVDGFNHTTFSVIPVSSKAPPYSPHRHQPSTGDNIALIIRNQQTGKTIFYAPGLEKIDAHVRDAMHKADILLVDGTFWSNDEMIRLGLSKKYARDMGHLPQSGSDGMIDALKPFQHKRRILIHINNSNPVLQEDSAEALQLQREGIEVAVDKMTIDF